MIPGFEQSIIGMKQGEQKTFTLSPAQAYGEWDSSLVTEINKTLLAEMIGAELYVGMELYTNDYRPVTIIDIGDVNATLDLNNPLAGKELTFTVKVLSIE